MRRRRTIGGLRGLSAAAALVLASQSPALAATAPAAAPGVLSAPSSSASQAGCKLRIAPNLTTWSISGFDPFSSQPPSRQFDVLFANDGTGPCTFDVVMRNDSEAFGLAGPGGRKLAYSLYDIFAGADVTPVLGRSQLRINRHHLTIQPRRQQLIRYAMNIDTGNLQGDGTFQQHILISAEPGLGEPLNQKGVTLELQVQPSAVMSLRGAYAHSEGGASVDLGDLNPGAINIPLQLYVQSTRGYRVSVESQNNGQLRLSGGGQWAVPYSISFGNHAINLAGSSSFDVHSGSSFNQDSLPIGFVIGDTSQRRAGIYRDLVTLSIAPL